MDIRLDQILSEDLKEFRALGVKGIFFGWESGNDRLLKLIGKRLTAESIMDKVRLLSSYKEITYWASGIMLIPTETFEETRNTIDFAAGIRRSLPGSVVSLFRFMRFPGPS